MKHRDLAGNGVRQPPLWSDFVFERAVSQQPVSGPLPIGVLTGEGIGPEVISVALRVLKAVEKGSGHAFELTFGGLIGTQANAQGGKPLSDEVIEFCRGIFARRGAILNGPGGGRYVYDLRKQFDLFCKFSPLKVAPELIQAGRMKPEYLREVDILLIRENVSGLYQGEWQQTPTPDEGRRAEHAFSYTEKQVRRIVGVAARIAGSRRGEMVVIVKDGGVPTISDLWRDCAVEIAAEVGVHYSLLNVDHAAYCLIQNPQMLDVVVAPNLFGDVLADLGSVLLGSRGLSYSGNFASDGAAVYQTNHGSAYDLVGKNQANPVGQICTLAMLLRESFGLSREAGLIENAVSAVWRQGWRTADLNEDGCRTVGTQEMGDLIVAAVSSLAAADRPRQFDSA